MSGKKRRDSLTFVAHSQVSSSLLSTETGGTNYRGRV